MKKSVFPILLLFLILILAAVSSSGCLFGLPNADDSVKAENVDEVLEIYELDIFVPVVKGQNKIVESGTYYIISDSPETKVIRLINNSKEISLLSDSSLLALDESEFTNIYFITADDFSMTESGIASLLENPVLADVNFTLKNSKRSPSIQLNENFTGVLVYTFWPTTNSTSLMINDGADAVQAVLPDGIATGNRIIGTPSPKPDSIEEDENGRSVLKWNAPIGSVGIKYYSENAPFYLLISFSALIGAIVAVFLWYRYQIKKLRKITNLIDDESSGFRKVK